MKNSEPEVWLPSTNQIMMASERAILAGLDTNLLLAIRTLEAEHAALSDESSDEPLPPYLAMAQSIVILATTLRDLISGYRAATELILHGD
jgi:hypothetical protein